MVGQTEFIKRRDRWNGEKVGSNVFEKMVQGKIPVEPLFENSRMIIIKNKDSPKDGAMSQIHLLVLPKTPIYNAIELEKKHIPLLKEMANQAQKVSLKEFGNPHPLTFSFHLHPDHSVGYLHMHAFLKKASTIHYKKHSRKNLDLKTIIRVLSNSKL